MNTCEVCGAQFEGRPDRPNRFCGNECHLSATRRTIEKECTVCGKKFKGSPKRQVCSLACVHQSMRLPERTCAKCGKNFAPEKKESKYCSWNCMCLDRTTRSTDEPEPIQGARYVALTKNSWAIVDEDDYERVSVYSWHAHSGNSTTYACARRTIDGVRRLIRLHHLVLNIVSSDTLVDHKNGNGLDCRKENLRIATKSQNRMNVFKKRGRTPYKGVATLPNGRFKASIRANNRLIYLGCYDIAEEAAHAYDAAARIHHGSFGRLNFPESDELPARR